MPKAAINDVELHYDGQGDGTQPIVFVHGFLLSSSIWLDPYIAHLPNRYRSYAIDMRGHGLSHNVTHGCNLAQMAADVVEFSRKERLGRFIYVGVSMGAAVGVQLALTHPEVLKALVLMNPGLGSTVSGVYRWAAPLLSLFVTKRWFLRLLLKSMMTTSPPKSRMDALLDEAMLVGKGTWNEYGHPNNRVTDLARLRQLEVPTLVIIGGKDRVLPLDMQHRIADLIPTAQEVVFEEEGHAVVLENPHDVFNTMCRFLEHLTSPPNALPCQAHRA